jgi:hypothetical protein
MKTLQECIREDQESPASQLISRMERETGQRVDDPGSNALAGLFGAMARMMGKTNYPPQDDVVAGLLILHQMTPEYQNDQRSKEMITGMLTAGMSPDDIRAMFGKGS